MAARRWLTFFALASLFAGCFLPKYDIDPTIDDLAKTGGGAGGVAGASASAGGTAKAGAGGAVAGAGAPASGGGGSSKGGSSAGGGSSHGGSSAAGSSTGGGSSTAGSSAAGSSTAGGGPCPDEGTGAGGKSGGATATTAIILFDNVVVQDAQKTKILSQWQFADGNVIADTTTDPRPADKWSRSQFFGDVNKISRAPGAHSTFLSCDGNPDSGSLKNTVPFTAAAQYYEASVLFAVHDFSGATITATVKLVTGGAIDVTCPAHALLYAVSGAAETPNLPITLLEGGWQNLSLSVPATGFTAVGEVGIRLTTYPCQ